MMALITTTTKTEASEWEKYISSSDLQSSTEIEPEIGPDPIFEALHAQPEWLDPLPVKLVLEASEIVDLPKYCDEENFVAVNAVEFLDKKIHSKIPESLSADDAWGCAKNSIGWTVGTSAVKEHGRRAILRIGEREIDLNKILPAGSDWVLYSARGITDIEKGWIHIAGEGELKAQDTQFLLSIYMDLKNHAPIISLNNITVDPVEPSEISLTAVDIDGDSLAYAIVDMPLNGLLKGKGSEYTFYPTTNFIGQDSFSFTVSDGYITMPSGASGKSAAQTVWLGDPLEGCATIAVPEDYDGDGKADLAVVYDRPPTEVDSSTSYGYFSLYAYRNTLYAGTYDNAGVILYSRNGKDWSQLVDLSPDPGESVYDMTFFKGYLYAGTENDGKLYRFRLDGTGQGDVDFCSLSDKYVFAVETFGGNIYAAFSRNNNAGIGVCKSSTGDDNDWVTINIPGQTQARDLVIYKDSLYLLTDDANSGRVYKWNGSGFDLKITFDTGERPLRAAAWAGYMWITTRWGDSPKRARIHRWNGVSANATQVYTNSTFKHFSNIKAFNGSLYATATEDWKDHGEDFGESALYRCDDPEGGQASWREIDRFEPGSAFGLEGFNGQIYVGTMDEKTRGKIYRYQDGLEWSIKQSSNGIAITNGAGANILCPADYDGDGTDDIALFDPPSGTYWVDLSDGGTLVVQKNECRNGFAVPADYDGDGIDDPAVYSGGLHWWIYKSTTETWVNKQLGGTKTDPVPGDYDGDGKADVAVFSLASQLWMIQGSAGSNWNEQFGWDDTFPVPGNYDSDSRYDYAVVNLNANPYVWYFKSTSSGNFWTETFGYTGTIPIPDDYDGDGITDMAVYDPYTYMWYVQMSTAGFWSGSFGWSETTTQLSFNRDGIGGADIATYNPATETLYMQSISPLQGISPLIVGMKGKVPVPADYDGDGKTDIASRSMHTPDTRWHIMKSTEGFFVMDYGWSAAKAVPGDYDGGGKDDMAVFHVSNPGPDWFYFSSENETYHSHWLGSSSTDDPVPADYNGDGIMDFGVRTEWGGWYIDYSGGGSFFRKYGGGYRHPVPTDYDGNGYADLGLYQKEIGKWYWLPMPSAQNSHSYVFGHQNTEPVPGDYNGDNAADYAVRDNNSDWSIMQTPVPPGDYRFEEFGW